MRRYFGVADHAIDTEEAKRLWEETEKRISRFEVYIFAKIVLKKEL